MSELTFPFNQSGKLRAPKFSDRGCLSCPPGSAFTSDDALSTLERVTANILMEGVKDYQVPRFPLAGRPVKKATFEQMSINSRTRQHVFYPDVHRAKFYDPMPSLQNYTVTRKLIQQCGGDVATAQLIANSNSLGCAPPRGSRGLSGKDRYFQSAATTVFELGPFCVTNYLELRDFQVLLAAYKAAAIKASAFSLEYEKIRRFVEMSMKNASAVAGTTRPRFFNGHFGEVPTSPGSLEWVLHAIDSGLGGEIMTSTEVTVKCSSQLLKYWVTKYMRDHGVEIKTDFSKVKVETQGFIASFEGADFVMQSLRTNRRVRFTNNVDPMYVEVYRQGDNAGEWAFQPFYVTELGDDPVENQANGYRQEMNTAYGDPAGARCDGVQKVLAELLLIDVGTAFHYEAFPTNPLAAQIDSNVETNLQNLWGATDIKWSFGVEVDEYWLKPMNAQLANTGAPCFSNIDKTWFAGRIKNGVQFVEDAPREMMSLLCAVPFDDVPLEKSDVLLSCSAPEPITITAQPTLPPELCTPLPEGVEEDEGDAGCARVPNRLQYDLPCGENRTVSVQFFRTDTNGSLTVPFTVAEGTATEGTSGSDHFRLANGNLVFDDGEDSASLDIVLHPVARGEGDQCFVDAEIHWTDTNLCEDSRDVTKLAFRLCSQAAGFDETDPPDDNCPSCS